MSGDADEVRMEGLFAGMGADARQARAMARQTLKRARQLAAERGISEVEALDYLLRLIVAGRSGEAIEPPDVKNV